MRRSKRTASCIIPGHRPPAAGERRSTGAFSLVEVLVSLGILLLVLAAVFVFFVDYGRNVNTESSALDTQLAARVALDEIARNVQQIGYNIDR